MKEKCTSLCKELCILVHPFLDIKYLMGSTKNIYNFKYFLYRNKKIIKQTQKRFQLYTFISGNYLIGRYLITRFGCNCNCCMWSFLSILLNTILYTYNKRVDEKTFNFFHSSLTKRAFYKTTVLVSGRQLWRSEAASSTPAPLPAYIPSRQKITSIRMSKMTS